MLGAAMDPLVRLLADPVYSVLAGAGLGALTAFLIEKYFHEKQQALPEKPDELRWDAEVMRFKEEKLKPPVKEHTITYDIWQNKIRISGYPLPGYISLSFILSNSSMRVIDGNDISPHYPLEISIGEGAKIMNLSRMHVSNQASNPKTRWERYGSTIGLSFDYLNRRDYLAIDIDLILTGKQFTIELDGEIKGAGIWTARSRG
jgi:hypothetical protein